MTGISTRPATAADVPALFAIRTSVHENRMDLAELDEAGVSPASVAEAIASAECVWLAEVDTTPVGFCMIDAAEACLFALFVAPSFEGKGIGRELLSCAEAALFEHHDVIWLTTGDEDGLRAHAFYERAGWRRAGMEPNGERRYEKRKAELNHGRAA